MGGAAFQFLVAIYGGFGAGLGILTLAALSIQGFEDVQELNALKNLASAVNYTVAAATFIVAGAVSLAAYAGDAGDRVVGRVCRGFAGAAVAFNLAETLDHCCGCNLNLDLFFQNFLSDCRSVGRSALH